jgi:hypothetical protein
MASGEENFPVPMMSRERKIRPAMTSGEFIYDLRFAICDLETGLTSQSI